MNRKQRRALGVKAVERDGKPDLVVKGGANRGDVCDACGESGGHRLACPVLGIPERSGQEGTR